MKLLDLLSKLFSTRLGRIWLAVIFAAALGFTVTEYLLLTCTLLLIEIPSLLDDIVDEVSR